MMPWRTASAVGAASGSEAIAGVGEDGAGEAGADTRLRAGEGSPAGRSGAAAGRKGADATSGARVSASFSSGGKKSGDGTSGAAALGAPFFFCATTLMNNIPTKKRTEEISSIIKSDGFQVPKVVISIEYPLKSIQKKGSFTATLFLFFNLNLNYEKI